MRISARRVRTDMISKVLLIDPFKCDGCKECETVCIARHTGYRKIAHKRIEILGTGSGDRHFFVPFLCQQCADAPCMAVCPKDAIKRDHDLARVTIDTNLCVGCALCVSACPSGLMAFAHDSGFPYKCDLCDGEPECVRVCDKKALEYVEPHRFQLRRAQQTATRMCAAFQGRLALKNL